MAQLKDLIVNGPSRFIGDVYATTFTGNLEGNASTATSATNAGMIAGLSVHSGRNNEANKIVRTDGNGYLQVGYINSSSGHEKNASNPTYVWGSNSSDSYLRSYQTSSLSVNYATTAGSCSGNAATATKATQDGNGNVIADTYLPLSGGKMTGTIIVGSYTAFGPTGGNFYLGTPNYPLLLRSSGTTTINSNTLIHSGNYNSYAPKLDGTGATGTWGISISGNAATATDADKLDGYHKNDILRKTYNNPTSTISLNDVVAGGIDFTVWDYAHSANINNQPGGNGASSAASVVSFGTAYPFQIYSDYNNTSLLYYRSYYNGTGWKAWRQFAFMDSIVASASKWANARTITLTGSVTGSVSIDGSANVSLATTTNHTHNYAGSSSAGGSANSALTLLYNNKFDTTYGSYAIFQQSSNISDFPHNGWFNSIKMLHNNSSGYFTEIAMSFTGEDGMWRRALQSGSKAGWYKMLDSGNYNSYAPKLDGTGASGTWGINISGNAATADNLAKTFIENINYAAYTTGLKLIRYDDNWEANGFPEKWTSGLSVMAGYCGWQLVTFGGSSDTPYFRKVSDSGVWSNWRALAFTDSNVASATNADMLDGYHESSFTKKLYLGTTDLNSISNSLLGQQDQIANATPESHYPIQEAGGLISILSVYNSTNQIYGTFSSNRWFARGAGGDLSSRTPWREFAFLDSNVASAIKLANSRTIWGQSFDGTGNVSGALTGVTDITASGKITAYNQLQFTRGDWCYISAGSTGENGTLLFQTGGTSRLIITSNGNVGIGTTSPSYKFHIAGVAYASEGLVSDGPVKVNESFVVDGTNGSWYGQLNIADDVYILGENTNINFIESLNIKQHNTTDNTETSIVSIDNSGNITLNVMNNNGGSYEISTKLGSLGIGIPSNDPNIVNTPSFLMSDQGYIYLNARVPSSPKYPLVVNGTIECTKLSQTSDIKYKSNIKQIEYEEALKIIENLNPVTWDWNENTVETGSSSGFVAQEAEEFIPNAISRDNENNLSLDYTQLHSYEIRVIQEQQKEIIKLKEKLKILENLIS